MSNRKTIIGYNRTVRLSWLEYTAERVASGCSEAEIVAGLRNLLMDQLSLGSKAKRGSREKTITLLLKTWVRVPSSLREFRDRGIDMFKSYGSEEHLALHWGMSMAAYPFFGAMAEVVGRLLRLQGEAAAPQVQRRARETFGERETVARSARYVLRAFVDWGVLKEDGQRGIYTHGKILPVSASRLIAWLVEALLRVIPNGTCPLKAVLNSPSFFPFILKTGPSRFFCASGQIEVIRHGLDEDLVTLHKSKGTAVPANNSVQAENIALTSPA